MPKNLMSELFGNNLRFLMKQKRDNQESIADLIGRKRSAVGSYVRGESSPNADVLIRLADYFGVSIDRLLREDLTISDKYPRKEPKVGSMTELQETYETSAGQQTEQAIKHLYSQVELLKEQVGTLKAFVETQNRLIQQLENKA